MAAATTSNRVYLGRFAGVEVFTPSGDHVGRVRDAVAALRADAAPPRLVGLVVEVPGRRRIFMPMTRVTRIDPGGVVTTGVVNLRRFEQRASETLVLAELFDRKVSLRETGEPVAVYDVGVEQQRNRDWLVTKLAIIKRAKRFHRGATSVVDWDQVRGLSAGGAGQDATSLLATLDDMRAADVASLLAELSATRRADVVRELDDERLADVLEELSADDQMEVLDLIGTERAALVLEEMDPDDAADLVAELAPERAEQLLARMDPTEAAPVRRLMTYEERTAGGLMTSEPVILPPDATVADALATVRAPELSPALASAVFVCRPPLETPTGKLLGTAHIQRLLREMPSDLVSGVLDTDLDPLPPEATLTEVASVLAAYNLLSVPVADDAGRLLGAVTVDDVIDHMLPENWRELRESSGSSAGIASEAADGT